MFSEQQVLLPADQRHLVGRFSYGLTPQLARQVRNRGGAREWWQWQLTPSQVADPALRGLREWFPRLEWDPARLWSEHVAGTTDGGAVMTDYRNAVLMRRILSRRQVLEVMTELWENHFHVPTGADGVFTWRVDYGRVLRRHALGSYSALLQRIAVHPAMGIYLGNAVSDKAHPNENQARELLELHTLGVGRFDERDVKNAARILTGWRVDMWRTWSAAYQPEDHWTGYVRVRSFAHANRKPDGRAMTQAFLSYLARHPDTARHVATKLACAFVRDEPPPRLVERLAGTYLAHDTRIKPVLRALVDSPEFRASRGAKVRDPEADVVATYRLLGVRVKRPSAPESAGCQLADQSEVIGSAPASWPRPDGRPLTGASWASPARLLGSMRIHYLMAGGEWPRHDIVYRTPADWLPKSPVRFDDLVDHLSRTVLHRPASARLLEACCQSVAVSPEQAITRDHPVVAWSFQRLLCTVLDSPEFLRR